MAKFGEGDPRWLVEERVDGTNVNGWHWVEKDAIEWCRMRLPELLVGPSLVEAGQDMELAITGLDTLTGEATINNRKNKIIPAYELEIKLAWQGSALGKTCQGKIHLPYLADENHDEEPDLRFSSAEEDAASQALKTAFLTGPGKKTLVSLIKQFVAELRAGGPAAPSSSASPAAPGAAAKPKLSSADPEAVRGGSGGSGGRATSEAVASAEGKGKGKAGKGGLRRLDLTEQFYCRAGDVYDCLTVEGRFKAFTQSAASIDPRPGGKLTWFGGAVQGEFSEVQPGKRLAMSWRFNNWAEGVTSQVVIDLAEPEPGHTVLTLQQTGIPEADQFGSEDVLQLTERGWRLQVFQRIRQVFGYGLGL
ncbi:activator of Hsp90 ATPase [Haematococcus lacustris]